MRRLCCWLGEKCFLTRVESHGHLEDFSEFSGFVDPKNRRRDGDWTWGSLNSNGWEFRTSFFSFSEWYFGSPPRCFWNWLSRSKKSGGWTSAISFDSWNHLCPIIKMAIAFRGIYLPCIKDTSKSIIYVVKSVCIMINHCFSWIKSWFEGDIPINIPIYRLFTLSTLHKHVLIPFGTGGLLGSLSPFWPCELSLRHSRGRLPVWKIGVS